MDKEKLKKLSDEKLMTLAVGEFIQLAKEFRDGDDRALDKAVYMPMAKERGLSFSISREFIHRIFTGEFDNADGIEVKVSKA